MAGGTPARDGLVALSSVHRPPTVLSARNAVVIAFALNGFLFASLVARIPDLRSGLDLGNGALGLLLLAIAAGSVLAMPSAGARMLHRLGGRRGRLGMVLDGVGLLIGASAPRGSGRPRSPRSGCSSTASASGSGTSR